MIKHFTWQKAILWVIVFSIAMGLFESATVIYLRTIYYPFGFSFPLAPINGHVAVAEILREAATIIMLLSISIIAGKDFLQRFGYFIFSFAVWDIFYYLFLKLFINWPDSIFTWDILFLIPIMWTSPVIYPLIISLTMLILGIIIIFGSEKENRLNRSNWKIWTLFITGSIILVFNFMFDFISFLHTTLTFQDFLYFAKKGFLLRVAANYVPDSFNVLLFIFAEFLIITGIFLTILKLRNPDK